jgi:NADH-quinone oxidoreductase subunit H
LQYFLPMACALLVGVCLWQLLAPPALTAATRYVLSLGSLGALVLLAASVLKPPAMSGPAGQLPGAWAGRTRRP